MPSTATEREVEERNNLILEHELKQKQFLELEESVKAVSQTKDAGALLQVARDVLGEYLDAKFGSTVTDKSIFLVGVMMMIMIMIMIMAGQNNPLT